MAAFHLGFLHFRQISEDRNPALPLNDQSQMVKKSCAALIQNNSGDVILRPEIHKPADLGSQRGALPARLYDQNDRCSEQLRDVVGAGLSRAANTVIKTHNSFDDCQGLFCFANSRSALRLLHNRPGEFPQNSPLSQKKEIKIAARKTKDPSMEHGIDVVGTAFERPHRNISLI